MVSRLIGVLDDRRFLAGLQLARLGGLFALRRHLDDVDAGRAGGVERGVGLRRGAGRHLDLLQAHGLERRGEDAKLVGTGRQLHAELPVEVRPHRLPLADDLDARLDDRRAALLLDHGAGDRPGLAGGRTFGSRDAQPITEQDCDENFL
jgi:hypothetical protein